MRAAADGLRVRVWDAPVRLVHWLLVGLLGFSWWSSEDHLNWHRWSGYAIVGLLAFRIYWGFVGSGAARFSNFLKGPRGTLAYLGTLGGRSPSETPGHNPLGALSVVAILLVLLVQVGTGLFAVDIDAFEAGPMSDRVSFETGRAIAEVHELSFKVLQVLTALHVAAVLFYLVWKRTDLVGPMITGYRRLPADPAFGRMSPWRLVVGIALAGATAWALSKGLRF